MGHIDKGIKLSPEHASLLEEAVAAGEFASADEVVEEALRDWKERRDNFGYTIAELRRLVQEGIDSGPSLHGPDVMERIKAKARQRFEVESHRN